MSLVIDNITKRFGGIAAVDGVSFQATAGRITALIGPNGAGKTSILNLISGVAFADSGRVELNGEDISGRPAWVRARKGLARTFQTPQLFEGMTVLETVMVGCHGRARSGLFSVLARTPSVEREEEMLRKEAERALDYAGVPAMLWHRIAAELAYGIQRRIEIARAVAMSATTFLLDEPAAGLNHSETHELSDLLLRLKADGKCLLLIEHDMDMVMSISDHLVAMNFGRKIAEGDSREIQTHPDVLEAYLGVELDDAQG